MLVNNGAITGSQGSRQVEGDVNEEETMFG